MKCYVENGGEVMEEKEGAETSKKGGHSEQSRNILLQKKAIQKTTVVGFQTSGSQSVKEISQTRQQLISETVKKTLDVAKELRTERLAMTGVKEDGSDQLVNTNTLEQSSAATVHNHHIGYVENLNIGSKALPSLSSLSGQEVDVIAQKTVLKVKQSKHNYSDDLNFYVPLTGCLERNYSDKLDVENQLKQFVSKKNKKIMLLLGQAGAGKSLFCQSMARKFLKDKAFDQNLVLYVSLTTLATPYQGLIKSALKPFNITDIEVEALKRAKVPMLLFLDGYDELSTHQNIYVTNQLDQWAHMKVVISCRSSFLIGRDSHYESFFVPVVGQQRMRSHLTEITLIPFSEDQIKRYIELFLNNMPKALHAALSHDWRALKQKHTSKTTTVFSDILKKMNWDHWRQAKVYYEWISRVPGVKALVQTPFLLRMTMEILPALIQFYTKEASEKKGLMMVTRSIIYDFFVKKLFERQEDKLILAGKLPNDRDIKEDYAEYSRELANEMHRKDIHYVDYSPGTSLFGKKVTIWDTFFSTKNADMIRAREGCPLRQIQVDTEKGRVTRTQFIHSSLQVYFTSRKLFLESINIEDKTQLELIKKLNEELNLPSAQESETMGPSELNVIQEESEKQKEKESRQTLKTNETLPEKLEFEIGHSKKMTNDSPSSDDEDEDLKLAMQLSLQENQLGQTQSRQANRYSMFGASQEDEDMDLQRALEASLSDVKM